MLTEGNDIVIDLLCKILAADMAVTDAAGFAKLAEVAKKALA